MDCKTKAVSEHNTNYEIEALKAIVIKQRQEIDHLVAFIEKMIDKEKKAEDLAAIKPPKYPH